MAVRPGDRFRSADVVRGRRIRLTARTVLLDRQHVGNGLGDAADAAFDGVVVALL
jgi:hypothetical protein